MIRKAVTRTQIFLFIAGMALSLQFVFAGEIYRWVDENGVVSYGEKIPKGITATEIKPDIHKVGTISTDSAAEEPEPESQSGGQPTRSQADIRKERESNCSIARDNISRLEPGIRVMVADEDGKPKILEGEKRLAWLKRSKEAEAKYCD